MISNEKQIIDELSSFKERQYFFSWVRLGRPLTSYGSQQITYNQCSSAVINFLNTRSDYKNLIEDICFGCTTYIIADEYLNWIDKDNDRQLLFLLDRFQLYLGSIPKITADINITFQQTPTFAYTYFSNTQQISVVSRNNLYINFIIELDTTNATLDHKIDFINNIKSQWAQQIANDSEIKWIDSQNSIQLKWAWEYLNKNGSAIFQYSSLLDSNDYYNYVLASIDKLSLLSFAEKKIFLDKMRKTWSQKKFRDSGKAKKPYHLPLTEQAKKSLDELAKLNDMKPAAFLEELIKEAYAKDIQDEKGKRRYNPNNPL